MRRRSALILLLLIALPLAGCASAIASLADEDTVPELAAAKQRTEAHENHTVFVRTTRADEPAFGIAIHEYDNPDSPRVFVLLHGVMADHRAFRFMAGDLLQAGSVWLVDLPGCGQSDKPDPDLLGPDGYSPSGIGDRVLDAIGQELVSRPGARVTLVGHSLGGAVVIRMLADPALRQRHRETLGHVAGAVLFSPLDVAVNRADPLFREIATIGGVRLRAAEATGILKGRIAEGTRGSVCDPSHALQQECQIRLSYMTDPDRRRALQAMLQQAVPWSPGFRPDWDAMESVVAMYANVDKPCLIVWGERDEVLPCAMGYKLAAQIRNARLICLPHVKHSPEIECPDIACSLIRQFAATGAVTAPPGSHETH